jgi:hypothetical protein
MVMTRGLFTLVVLSALAPSLVGCSGDEAPAHPVPVDSGTDAAPPSDGAVKSEASPDQVSSDGGGEASKGGR